MPSIKGVDKMPRIADETRIKKKELCENLSSILNTIVVPLDEQEAFHHKKAVEIIDNALRRTAGL